MCAEVSFSGLSSLYSVLRYRAQFRKVMIKLTKSQGLLEEYFRAVNIVLTLQGLNWDLIRKDYINKTTVVKFT